VKRNNTNHQKICEHTVFDGLKFHVLRADSRRVHTLLVEKLPQEA
jgi:Mg2+/Co2+ transporter CorC